MRIANRRTGMKLGILVATFLVTTTCVFIAMRALVSSPPLAGAVDLRQRGSAPDDFQLSGSDRHGEALARAKTTPSRHHDQIRQQLRPVLVKVTSPRAVPIGERGRVTLAIERDPSHHADVRLAFDMDRLDAVRTEVAGDKAISVYQTYASSAMTVQLYEPTSDTKIPSHEDKTLAVPEEGVRWKWDVATSGPDAKMLEFELLANVTIDASSGPWPIGTLGLEMAIEASPLQRVIYYAKHDLDEIGTLWQLVLAAAGGLVTLAAAAPILAKWLGFKGRGAQAPDAQMST